MALFQRQATPPVYSDYRKYKPYLRADFLNRCAYCLLHEGDEFGGGFHHFAIDHFRPQRFFPALRTEYTNLYYVCNWCNRAKSDTWPSEEELGRGFHFVDPCQEDLYITHAQLDPATGKLVSKTKPGEYTIEIVRLNRKSFARLRVDRIQAQKEINACLDRIAQLGEPDDDVARELILTLKEKVRLLGEKYINPKVPYESEDISQDADKP